MSISCTTLDDLQAEAQRFIKTLQPHEHSATLVTLSGVLGAGKTTFVKALARELGVSESVTSPTFVLEKRYTLPDNSVFDTLIHIDAYRLDGGDALIPLDFEELMRDTKAVVLFEWPEQVEGALPKPAVRVTIEILPDESRRITYA